MTDQKEHRWIQPDRTSPRSESPPHGSLLLSFYGDDFTGSTDALEFLTRAGARTALFMKPPTPEQLDRYPGLQAVGVAGMTRSLTPDAMEAELRPALAALRRLSAPHVHYKVCSTFDSSPSIGSIGRVIDVATEIFDAPFVPLLVGAPALGRYCLFGNLFARMGIGSDGEIHRLDRHPSMCRHPTTPADESDLRLHLARQTRKRVGLFDILKVALPAEEAHSALDKILAGGFPVILFDVLYPEQLQQIGELIDGYASAEQPLFSVGSSAIEMALGAHWASTGWLEPRTQWSDAEGVDRLLIASGSCSPVTGQQIKRALADGFAEVPIDTAALVAENDTTNIIHQATRAAVERLKHGQSVIVHTSIGDADSRVAATTNEFSRRGLSPLDAKIAGARLFGWALGQVVRDAVEQTGVGRVVFAGGDTSSHAAQALQIEALEMIAPLAPGAPLCKAHAPGTAAGGLELVFKGGQVGAANFFTEASIRRSPPLSRATE